MGISKRVLGAEHPHMLSMTANLASMYMNQERLEDAQQLIIQVTEMNRRALGSEHPHTLSSMANLIEFKADGRRRKSCLYKSQIWTREC
jgi:hypothetical protein